MVHLNANLVLWSDKMQRAILWSFTKAKYKTLSVTGSKITWVQNLLYELGCIVKCPMLWCDTLRATYLNVNPIFHIKKKKMKHLKIDIHFVCEGISKATLSFLFFYNISNI